MTVRTKGVLLNALVVTSVILKKRGVVLFQKECPRGPVKMSYNLSQFHVGFHILLLLVNFLNTKEFLEFARRSHCSSIARIDDMIIICL